VLNRRRGHPLFGAELREEERRSSGRQEGCSQRMIAHSSYHRPFKNQSFAFFVSEILKLDISAHF